MFLFRRSRPAVRSPADAVRRLYRKAWIENTSEARGLRLLRGWLSQHQRAQFDSLGYFEVVGCNSGKRYRIYHGKPSPNVYEVDDAGCPMVGWCFLPRGYLATGDVILAQKIGLETDEHSVLAIANKFLPSREL